MASSTTALSRPFARLGSLAPLLLRLAVGSIMLGHGIGKFNDGVGDVWGAVIFDSLGVPAPVVMAWVVALIETVGGALLIIGFLSRIVAILFAGVMIGALFYVSIDLGFTSGPAGPASDLNIALLAGALAIVLIGPGRISMDKALGLDDWQPSPMPVRQP